MHFSGTTLKRDRGRGDREKKKKKSAFLNSVGDYWVWYLRQQEAGLPSPAFLNSCSLAVLTGFSTGGSVSSFNHDLDLATREENPGQALRPACFSSCWEKLCISCVSYGMGKCPAWSKRWYRSDNPRESPTVEATWGMCGVSLPVSHPAGLLSQDSVPQLDTALPLAHPSADFLPFSSVLADAAWPTGLDLTRQDVPSDEMMPEQPQPP